MPRYTFEDTKTGKTSIHEMKISELDQFKKDNPHLNQVITPLKLVDPYSVGRYKVDSKFNETMRNIKKNNRGNDINHPGNLVEI